MLSVIDGRMGMEGDGPGDGQPVKLNLALAGRDSLAADVVAAHLMAFSLGQIGYLWYGAQQGLGVGNLGETAVVGDSLADCRGPFRPHRTFPEQLHWREERAMQLALGTRCRLPACKEGMCHSLCGYA